MSLGGLEKNDARIARQRLGRAPTPLEAALLAGLWSEHCSYRTTRAFLRRLPTRGVRVIAGPGGNAGAVDLGGGLAAVFKMESHNHPSAIEPVEGAATGVGGVLRDIFAMGAQPIALANVLRFGPLATPRARRLLAGVAKGIADYGNCVGVPTAIGATDFAPGFEDNILVNVMAVGITDAAALRTASVPASQRDGAIVALCGAPTGRDGLHGAAMASEALTGDDDRALVQVGDPYTGKRLMEATLEAMREPGLTLAAQDLGAAGLTSALAETAQANDVDMDIDLRLAETRADDLTAEEILLAETQERMLMLVAPDKFEALAVLFARHGLGARAIGRLATPQANQAAALILRDGTQTLARMPLAAMEAPEGAGTQPAPPLQEAAHISLPPSSASPRRRRSSASVIAHDLPLDRFLAWLCAGAEGASRRWIWEQFDASVGGRVMSQSGDPAATLALDNGAALAIAVASCPRISDPMASARDAATKVYRRLCATAALPVALTNCLNFGDPTQPSVLTDFSQAIAGLSQAARKLDMPVVSGNVSLYNAAHGRNIPPTPMVGGVGVVPRQGEAVRPALSQGGLTIVAMGTTRGDGACSLAARFMKTDSSLAPRADFAAERQGGGLVARLARRGLLTMARAVDDGGLLAAILASTLAGSGNISITLTTPPDAKALGAAYWLGEDPARWIVATPTETLAEILEVAAARDVPARILGTSHSTSVDTSARIILDAADIGALTQYRGDCERILPEVLATIPNART